MTPLSGRNLANLGDNASVSVVIDGYGTVIEISPTVESKGQDEQDPLQYIKIELAATNENFAEIAC